MLGQLPPNGGINLADMLYDFGYTHTENIKCATYKSKYYRKIKEKQSNMRIEELGD